MIIQSEAAERGLPWFCSGGQCQRHARRVAWPAPPLCTIEGRVAGQCEL